MPLLLVGVGEAKSGGDEDGLRLSRGGRRWCMCFLCCARPPTLPWELPSPSEKNFFKDLFYLFERVCVHECEPWEGQRERILGRLASERGTQHGA